MSPPPPQEGAGAKRVAAPGEMAQEIAPAAFERELGKFRVVRRADFTGEALRRLSPEEARKWRVEQAEARDKEERAAAKKEAQRRTRGADGAQSGGFYGRLAAELEAAGYDNVQEVLKEFKKVSCLCRPARRARPTNPAPLRLLRAQTYEERLFGYNLEELEQVLAGIEER